MLDRLASRETSQQMVKAVLGEDILRELGMLSKQSARAAGESEESENQHEAAERAGTSNLNPRTQGSSHRCITEYFTSSPEFNGRRCAADADKGSDAHGGISGSYRRLSGRSYRGRS